MIRNNLLADLSKQFGLQMIKLNKFLKEVRKEFVISNQVYKSGTSIGANIAESKYAQTKPDFIAKLSIALKEAGETDYWLDLLFLSETIEQKEYDSLKNDLNIIIGTLIKIIKKTRDNLEE